MVFRVLEVALLAASQILFISDGAFLNTLDLVYQAHMYILSVVIFIKINRIITSFQNFKKWLNLTKLSLPNLLIFKPFFNRIDFLAIHHSASLFHRRIYNNHIYHNRHHPSNQSLLLHFIPHMKLLVTFWRYFV